MANFNSPTRDRILNTLKAYGRMTVAELGEELQLARTVLSGAVKRAKAAKLIRIAGWQRRYAMGQTWVPIYGLGGNPDAPHPERESNAQIDARYYAKHRGQLLAKQRAKRGTVNPLLDLLR